MVRVLFLLAMSFSMFAQTAHVPDIPTSRGIYTIYKGVWTNMGQQLFMPEHRGGTLEFLNLTGENWKATVDGEHARITVDPMPIFLLKGVQPLQLIKAFSKKGVRIVNFHNVWDNSNPVVKKERIALNIFVRLINVSFTWSFTVKST